MQVLAEDLKQYLARLRDAFVMLPLGHGAYGVVYDHRSDRDMVVKISANDPGDMEYVKFCMNNSGNRWLPEVHDVHLLDLDEPYEVYAVFLQRLEKTTPQAVQRVFAREIAPWVTSWDTYSERTRLSFPEWKNVLRTAPDPQTRRLAQFLITHFNRLDLLNQNFMQRGSQVVFNDPLTPIK